MEDNRGLEAMVIGCHGDYGGLLRVPWLFYRMVAMVSCSLGSALEWDKDPVDKDLDLCQYRPRGVSVVRCLQRLKGIKSPRVTGALRPHCGINT